MEPFMNLYRGVFNDDSAEVLYRYAHSAKQAWALMCLALAKQTKRDVGFFLRKYDYEKQKGVLFEIEIEYVMGEEEDGKI
jgi:hypothetical protein